MRHSGYPLYRWQLPMRVGVRRYKLSGEADWKMRKDFNTSAKQALPFWKQPRCQNPRLPAELLDHTVDLPRDERYALESCHLVSKSWVWRIRKHLFTEVEFLSLRDAQSLENSFRIHPPPRVLHQIFDNG